MGGPAKELRTDQELALLAKALGHPVRVKILRLLARRSDCMCGELVEELPLAQSTVSQHLKVLRDNGFATVREEGPRRIYAFDATPLRDVDEWLAHFRGFWTHKLDALATEVARGKKKKKT